MQRIVILCGGRGSGTIQQAFLERGDCEVTTVVNPYDDGKSTGEIRRMFAMPGPSDLRKNLAVMLPKDHPAASTWRRLFAFRYPENVDGDSVIDELVAFVSGEGDLLPGLAIADCRIKFVLRRLLEAFLRALARRQYLLGAELDFRDCSLMNCVFAGAHEVLDQDFLKATAMLGRVFKARGTVLPTSGEDLKLVAIRENDEVLFSEAEIVTNRSAVPIHRIYLVERYPDREFLTLLPGRERREYLDAMDRVPQAAPEVTRALRRADLIVYGPGTQHSSLYPTYRTRGIARAIAGNKGAAKVLVTNLRPDADIPGFTAADILGGGIRYLNEGRRTPLQTDDLVTHVLANEPSGPGADQVQMDRPRLATLGPEIVSGTFEDQAGSGRHGGRETVEACLELLRGSILGSAR